MSERQIESIDETASDFLARRESGEWTADDQARLSEWLSASPLHRVSWLRIELAWERTERLKVLRTADGKVLPPGEYVLSPFFNGAGRAAEGHAARNPEVALSDRQRPVPRRKWAWGIAAGLAAVLGLSATWVMWPQTPVYRTPIGGLETVPLPDGSMVTLNTDSAIRVAVKARERRVTLERGEAFFRVAKDPTRPFVVQAGNRCVIAVGTQFSVLRDRTDDEIQVVVTEGTVRLERSGAALLDGEGASANAGSSAVPGTPRVGETLLPAGAVAHAGDSGVLVQQKSETEAEEALSWRQGELIFHEATLADAIAEFNRYNARQVVIDDPAVASLKVAGNFRATNVDAFVRLLEKGYPIAAQERDGAVVLKAR